MAERRMFAKSVVISDSFFEMSIYAQYLYFIFGIYADDDGFVGSPKTIMRQCGVKSSAMEELLKKDFVISFKSGIIVLKHWKINNYLRNDRYKKTIYTAEFNSICEDENHAYIIKEKDGIPMVYQRYTQYSIDKDSIDKDNIYTVSDKPKTDKKPKHKYGKYKNVLLSDEDIGKLKKRFGDDYLDRIEKMSAAIEMKGYKYKNHYLALLNWAGREAEKCAAPKTIFEKYGIGIAEKE